MPEWRSGVCLRNAMRSRARQSIDFGSVRCRSTLREVSPIGSQGVTPGSVKPAPGASRQGIGVRIASRPAYAGQYFTPNGSRRSGGSSATSRWPISSPWYSTGVPRRPSSISSAVRARCGSSPAQRVANRDMSWFEPVHAGQAPWGSSASMCSTTSRIGAASSGALMNGKLNASCNSSRFDAVERGERCRVVDGCLAEQQPGRVVGVGDPAPALQDVVQLGPVLVVDGPLPEQLRVEGIVRGRGRVVPQLRVLDEDVADVDAEAVDAAVEPEADDVVERVAHVLVPPVEIGLLAQVVVHVVLTGGRVERPRRTAEAAHPVVRRRAVRFRIGPHVPVAMARGARRSRVDEPRVLLARVVRDEVEEHADAPAVRGGDQLVERGEGPHLRLDRAVVGDVVAPVGVRRHGDRAQPDRVDTQPLEVVEMVDDPLQIAVAIGVRVRERQRIDLVQHARGPPRHLAMLSSRLYAAAYTATVDGMSRQAQTGGPEVARASHGDRGPEGVAA